MNKPPSRFAQAFVALAYAPYRQFAASLLLTSLGVQLLQTAILWQVYELTGDALLLGFTGLARAVPHIILSLVGGVAADRVHRVRLVQAGQAANGLLVMVLAGLTLSGAVEVWQLYAITVLNGAFTALTQPARTAIIPSLIPRDNIVQAIGLNSTITQSSQIVGPAIAGFAIGFIGLGSVYVLNGAFYLLAMLVILPVKIPFVRMETKESPLRSLGNGLRFVRLKPVIIALLVLDLGAVVLGSYRALLPILSTDLGVGPGGYGVLSAAPGLGSLIGAGFILSLGDMKYKGLFTLFGVLAYSAALVLLALSPWFALALVAAALLGATNSVQAIPRNSAILGMSPEAMRGRVESFRSMLAGGGPPLGYSLSGAVAAALGPASALLLGAAACAALATGIGIGRKELRAPDLGAEDSTGDEESFTISAGTGGR